MNALERPQPRSDAWAANASHSTVRYRLQAEAEPDTLCRVLNLFALQFLTPHSVLVSQQDDWLDIEVGIGGLSWHRAQVIAQKLRNLVCVGDLSLETWPVWSWLRSETQRRKNPKPFPEARCARPG